MVASGGAGRLDVGTKLTSRASVAVSVDETGKEGATRAPFLRRPCLRVLDRELSSPADKQDPV